MSPLILLTNDDGIRASGLTALARSLRIVGRTVIVAPERDNSAVSHALTMRRPLRIEHRDDDVYSVDGTPADCIILALEKLLPAHPALIVSGINPGPNIGDDISYSGTVSAAIEGTMLGVPSIAMSIAGEPPFAWDDAAGFAVQLARHILANGLPADTLLNVNYPDKVPRGVRFTRQGRRTYEGAVKETRDPWGRKHYWIGGGIPSVDQRHDSDGLAVQEGYISITPLHLDLTNYEALALLRTQTVFRETDNGRFILEKND